MVNSNLFWTVLLASVVIFWLLPPRWRYPFLTFVSIGYLYTLEPLGVIFLGFWVVLFYFVVPRPGSYGQYRLRVFGALVLAILAFLGWFKYVPPLLHALSGESGMIAFAIPLGISYLTFKLIHYAIEVGRGNIQKHGLADFACYMYLFPIFTAGPIERFDHFLEHRETKWHLETAIEGVTRIIHGLVKKFVIAGLILQPQFVQITGAADITALLDGLQSHSAMDVWLFLILAYLIAYMDFAAYSDIAIGASRLFGIRIMENFDLPIIAANIGNFWKRWHMTLAGWCQTYIYMPVLGMTRKPYLAIFATFVTMGLWHAGAWNWLFWGLYHGAGVACYLAWTQLKRRRRWNFLDQGLWSHIGVPVTFLFVAAGFAFTTTYGKADIYASFRLLAKLFGMDLAA